MPRREAAASGIDTGGGSCTCGGSCPRCRSSALHRVERVLDSGGEALARPIRQRFEARLGADLSDVRVHRGIEAAESASALGARAYTVGPHIVMGSEIDGPQSTRGQRLLAHELAHALQQRGARASGRPAIGAADDRYEREAASVAEAVVSGQPVPAISRSAMAVQRLQRTTDADVESGTGVGAALTSGTMTAVPGVHGTGFDASSCFGVDGCNVHFTFEKAYQGTYPYGAAGGSTVRGLYVKIVARPDDNCWSCNHLELVQVLRFTTMTGGALVTAEPTSEMRKTRSGWGDATAASRGWEVDATDSGRNPFYSQSWVGQSGDFRTPAILWDTPGSFESVHNVGKDFQTCLICVNGTSRIALGCVTWGYYVDASGAINFQPQPTASCSATTQLRDSAARWDRLPGHEHVGLGSDRPGRPAGETPQPIPPGGSGMG